MNNSVLTNIGICLSKGDNLSDLIGKFYFGDAFMQLLKKESFWIVCLFASLSTMISFLL